MTTIIEPGHACGDGFVGDAAQVAFCVQSVPLAPPQQVEHGVGLLRAVVTVGQVTVQLFSAPRTLLGKVETSVRSALRPSGAAVSASRAVVSSFFMAYST